MTPCDIIFVLIGRCDYFSYHFHDDAQSKRALSLNRLIFVSYARNNAFFLILRLHFIFFSQV